MRRCARRCGMATPASSPASRRVSQHPLLLVALWIVSALLSWRLIGAHVASRFIGIDPAGFRVRRPLVTARRPAADGDADLPRAPPVDGRAAGRAARREAEHVAALERRQFLVNGVAGTAAVVGAVATGGLGAARAYRPLAAASQRDLPRRGREDRAAASSRRGRARASRRTARSAAPARRSPTSRSAPAPSKARTARRSRATRSSAASPTSTPRPTIPARAPSRRWAAP